MSPRVAFSASLTCTPQIPRKPPSEETSADRTRAMMRTDALVPTLCCALSVDSQQEVEAFHLRTSIRTLAVLPIPMARAAPLLRSIERPLTNGPRSLIRTITDLPLWEFVTRTRVPKGSVRCAAVMAPGLNLSPEAVRCPANSLP